MSKFEIELGSKGGYSVIASRPPRVGLQKGTVASVKSLIVVRAGGLSFVDLEPAHVGRVKQWGYLCAPNGWPAHL